MLTEDQVRAIYAESMKHRDPVPYIHRAIESAVLAEKTNQEPVAWRVICDRVMLFDDYKEAATYCAEGEFPEPLFAAMKEEKC